MPHTPGLWQMIARPDTDEQGFSLFDIRTNTADPSQRLLIAERVQAHNARFIIHAPAIRRELEKAVALLLWCLDANQWTSDVHHRLTLDIQDMQAILAAGNGH